MKNLYGTININKNLGDVCINENINYYKLKNKKFGLEIVKCNNSNDEEIEVTNMENLTDNEDKIDNILKQLVIKEIKPNAEDVIEDILKMNVV